MKKTLVVSIAATVLPLLVGNALADDATALTLGTRLRVTTDHRLVGRLLAQDDQSLTLDLGKKGDPVVVPRASITRIQESLGPSRRGKGALVGSAAAVALSIALGIVYGQSCSRDSFLCFTHTEMAAGAAILLVPPGAVIGALTKGEHWRKVPLDRLRVGLAPTRGGGIGASVSLSF
jgi:hypothetical protein